MLKEIEFLGTTKQDLRELPSSARRAAGFELRVLQNGEQPTDTKPMPTIGRGVEELRIWVSEGTYRVIYYMRLPDAVYVLHVFEKKTQATAKREIDLTRRRFADLMAQKGS